MKNNIVLIGMPGSGKSTIGVQLAKWFGFHFLDCDILIQEKTNKTLETIIKEYGLKGFLEIENEVNLSINVEKTVISTGGSAIYGAAAMKHFKENAHIVYLAVSPKVLEKRLGDLRARGVVSNKGDSILDIYNERKSYYEKYADLTINLDEEEPAESALKVSNAIKNTFGLG